MKKIDVEPKSKIIWDSGKGYEIGYFVKASDEICANTFIVNLITGNQTGMALRNRNEIHWYSDETIDLMYKKYRYFIHFPITQKTFEMEFLNN